MERLVQVKRSLCHGRRQYLMEHALTFKGLCLRRSWAVVAVSLFSNRDNDNDFDDGYDYGRRPL